MCELHTFCMCENFHMNIDVPAGVGAPPLDTQLHGHYHSNDIPSIRCWGYYFFFADCFFVRLLFEGGYYSRVVFRKYHEINDSLIICMGESETFVYAKQT